MNPSIVVYSKPACVQCTAVKRRLTAAGVPFVELDLTAPEQAAQLEHFKAEGFLTAPVTEYGGQLVGGYNVDAIDSIIEQYQRAA